MSAKTLTINVRNHSLQAQNMFFFQEPAIYTGGPEVYTNSLYMKTLLPYETSGAVLTFSLMVQYYAGVAEQKDAPQVGKPWGRLAASQAIGLTPAPGGQETNNTTTMIIDPSLGLTKPVATTGPQAGSFRIVVPTYDPVLSKYDAGSAVQLIDGGLSLANFVTAQPTTNLDCQPVLVFYVQIGTYTAGTVMNFTQSSQGAAICDFTPGYATYSVDYNADGTWTTQPFASVTGANGRPQLIEATALTEAEVKNEAGTRVISTGFVESFNEPITVQNLNHPEEIEVHKEYQVGGPDHAFIGCMCTDKDGSTAVFAP